MKLEIVPATMAHAAAIDLRSGDRREVEAHGTDKMTALKASLDRSIWADAYMVDGEVAAILGCGMVSLLGGEATPWLITGKPVDQHKKMFLQETRARIAALRREYTALSNMVHAPYTEAIRWARWLGFTVDPPVPMGPFSEPFCRIWMRGER